MESVKSDYATALASDRRTEFRVGRRVMKKKTMKRLVLNRETVRGLSEPALAQAVGGIYTYDFAVTCRKLPPPPSVAQNPCDI
jgi:hypothetical protein